ncbi:MAG: DMT family transporter [Methylococcaceae bacterium]|nr:DMT family transporter [Methylococcaceae bacterium]
MKNHPAARGAFLALLAALLFGASTPLVQRVGVGVSAWMTAAMLYSGAAITGLLLHSGTAKEAALRRRHWPRLLLMALCGAVIGPVALSWGLQHTSGMSASLMLTLEAVFTVLLSCLLYREHIDRRGLAIVLLTLGGGLLVFDRAGNGATQVIGLLAVTGATVSWALDNTLSRALADLDPGRVVLGKATVGAACSFLIAAATGETVLSLSAGVGLFLIGVTGYGLSLRFYLLAQRALGAARTGSVFATAPFIGAVIAFGLGERGLSPWLLGGAALMVAGVVLHISERHEHKHEHKALEHEHAHTHDDGHHTHIHAQIPVGAHSHRHMHELVTHSHSHTPDLHHVHKH